MSSGSLNLLLLRHNLRLLVIRTTEIRALILKSIIFLYKIFSLCFTKTNPTEAHLIARSDPEVGEVWEAVNYYRPVQKTVRGQHFLKIKKPFHRCSDV